MGRRKRKVIRAPKRKLPDIFLCHNCGNNAIRVVMIKMKQIAIINCGKCGLQAEFPITHAHEQPIDIYCKFTDKVSMGELV